MGTPAPAARSCPHPSIPPLWGGRFLSPKSGSPISVAVQGRVTWKGWGVDRASQRGGALHRPGQSFGGAVRLAERKPGGGARPGQGVAGKREGLSKGRVLELVSMPGWREASP